MAHIGKIIEETRNGKNYRHGHISTLAFNLQFEVRPNTQMNSPMAPDVVIVAKNVQGQEIQVGAGWKRTINKPGKEPFEVISLTFDDPSFPQPLNVAAFKNNEGGWDISYRRRQDRQAA